MINDDAQSRNQKGRPATGTNPSIGVRMTHEELEKLDEWRAKQPGIPTRPEAIRRLVQQALRTAK
jgi:hypothetical protein